MVKSCLHDLSFMSKKCSRLRWTMKLTSLGNEAYCIFLWFLMKNRTHSRCYFVEMVRFIYIHCGLIPLNGVAVSASLVVFQSIGEGGGIASEAEVVACVWCKHNRATHVEAMEVALQ